MKCTKCNQKVGENGARGLCAKHYKQIKLKPILIKLCEDFLYLISKVTKRRFYTQKELDLFKEVNIDLIGRKFTHTELKKCIEENNLQEYVDNLHKKAVKMLELAKKEEINK